MKYTKQQLLQMEPVEVYKLRLNGEIGKFPNGFLTNNNKPNLEVCAILTRYLLEDVLKWNEAQICKKLRVETLKQYSLGGMSVMFKNSVYLILENAYPGKYKEWQMAIAPKDYWNEETARVALKWFIEEKLKWTDEQVYENFCKKTLLESDLKGILYCVYKGNWHKALASAFPGKYNQIWRFKNVSPNYWNKETAKKAVKWLIEEKLQYTDEDVCKNLTKHTFRNNGLAGMMASVFNDCTYDAINNAYPGKYKPWQLKSVPRNYWNKETAKVAVKWLIEEKLQYTDEDICNKLRRKHFIENGLRGMLLLIFDMNIVKALNNAYPGKFSRTDGKNNGKLIINN